MKGKSVLGLLVLAGIVAMAFASQKKPAAIIPPKPGGTTHGTQEEK